METTINRSTVALRTRTVFFWIATGIIALETGVGAGWDLLKIPFVRNIMVQLGYPEYILIIMGICKILGVPVLLAPGLPRLKEWVYAGLFFIYTGAAASHLAIGQGADAVGPFIFALLTIASWALRPASRKDFKPLYNGFATFRARIITYWITTALVVFQLGSGGIADILRPSSVVEGMVHLGYPVYFCVILGIWKVLGAIAVLLPRTARLKEWAYAGAFFDLIGAAASHLATGDPAIKLVGPLLFAGFALVSWALRPASRRDLLASQAV